MKVTYMLLDSLSTHGEVLSYFHSLSYAREYAKRLPKAVIVKLVGSDFAQGYHAYKLYWNGKRFRYVKKHDNLLEGLG